MRTMKGEWGVKIWVSASDTYAWATRAGSSWPCSTLSGRRVFAEFDSGGDLVDVAVDGKPADDIDGHEFSAMMDDLLGR